MKDPILTYSLAIKPRCGLKNLQMASLTGPNLSADVAAVMVKISPTSIRIFTSLNVKFIVQLL